MGDEYKSYEEVNQCYVWQWKQIICPKPQTVLAAKPGLGQKMVPKLHLTPPEPQQLASKCLIKSFGRDIVSV